MRDRLNYALLLYWTSYSMLPPVLAPYLRENGVGPGAIGLILSLRALPAFALAIPFGIRTARVGTRSMVMAGALVMASGGVVLQLGKSMAVYSVALACVGVGGLSAWIALQGAMIAPRSANEATGERVHRIARYSLLGTLGQIIGPPLGGLLVDHTSYFVTFIAFTVLAVTLSLLYAKRWTTVAGRRPEAFETGGSPVEAVTSSIEVAAPSSAAPYRYRDTLTLFRNRNLLVTCVISFVALYLTDIVSAWHPLYFRNLGISATVTGFILASGTACGLCSRFLFPILIRRAAPGVVSALVVLTGAVGVGSVAAFESVVPLVACVALAGAALGIAQPLTLELIARFTTAGVHAPAVALRMLANRLGQAVDPLVFGVLLGAAGMRVALFVSALVIGALGLGASLALHRSAATGQRQVVDAAPA